MLTPPHACSTTLRVLCANHARLGDAGAKLLCNALRHNRNLHTLHLSGNGIEQVRVWVAPCPRTRACDLSVACVVAVSQAGGHALAALVADSPSLLFVDLSWNSISGRAALAMADALRSNGSLRAINLAWNALGDAGGEAIAAALLANDALQAVDLSCTLLQGRSAVALAAVLPRSAALRALHLHGNQLGARCDAAGRGGCGLVVAPRSCGSRGHRPSGTLGDECHTPAHPASSGVRALLRGVARAALEERAQLDVGLRLVEMTVVDPQCFDPSHAGTAARAQVNECFSPFAYVSRLQLARTHCISHLRTTEPLRLSSSRWPMRYLAS